MLVALSLTALVGMVALTIDLGLVSLAAQKAQDVADASALAAVAQCMSASHSAAQQRIDQLVTVNANGLGTQVTYVPGEVVFYQGGQTAPGYGVLAGSEEGVTVTTHATVQFHFARILGVNSTVVTRRSTAVRLLAGGLPIVPMWIGAGTPQDDMPQDLHATDGPDSSGRVPGNFGWLVPKTGRGDFDTLLGGYNVPQNLIEDNYVAVGENMDGLPGQRSGQWDSALGTSGDGRLARGTRQPWTSGTFENHLPDDPRLIVVPMVYYAGGNGANAQWHIESFGLFWLESISKQGNDKIVRGRFIDYSGAGGGGSLEDYLGLSSIRIVG